MKNGHAFDDANLKEEPCEYVQPETGHITDITGKGQ